MVQCDSRVTYMRVQSSFYFTPECALEEPRCNSFFKGSFFYSGSALRDEELNGKYRALKRHR